MRSTFRRTVFVLVWALAAAMVVRAQQTPPPPPAQQAGSQTAQGQATPPAASATPPRQMSPEQQAYNAAGRITDPAKKLEAYEKIVAEYPKSDFLRQVRGSIFYTLLDLPDRKADLGPAFDRLIADISDTSSPDTRLSQIVGPVSRMLDKDVTIEQAEPVLSKALAALDFDQFAKSQKESAARAKRTEPTEESLKTRFATTRASALEVMGRLHRLRGDDDRALVEFKEALAANPSLSTAPVALAEIEAKRGNDEAALGYYLSAAAGAKLKKADDAAFRALYAKVHGNDDGIEEAIDRAFLDGFPNPVHPEPWTATAARSDRIVLAELFTGSGCGPCVAADYALDAVLERYPASVLATLVYHVHIPQPDPMTTPGSSARKVYYEVKGVPTFNVDGALSRLGGGGRDNTEPAYENFIKDIDKALETPAGAALSLRASLDGGKIAVSTTISKVAAGAKDLRLHLALAERELRFGGENGMRFHPLVVRELAGAPVAGKAVVFDPTNTPLTEYAFGLPIALGADGRATIDYTFDLSLPAVEIKRSLDDEIAKRRRTETAGATPREYKAEGHPMMAIDPAALVVVAFVQDGAKHVLQAAQIEVVPAAAGGKR